jgi:hypothetical protein
MGNTRRSLFKQGKLEEARAAARAKIQDDGKAVDMLPEIMSAFYSGSGVSGSGLPFTTGPSSPTLYSMEVDRRSGPDKFEIRVATTFPPAIYLALSIALSSGCGRSTMTAASWRFRGGGQRRSRRRRVKAKSNGCGTCRKVLPTVCAVERGMLGESWRHSR